MSLRYYMDVHVPSAITEGLLRRGVDALTSQADGTSTHTDNALLLRATELARVLVTQDEDFLGLAADWNEAKRTFTGIVFMPQLGAGIGRYIEDLELVAKCCDESEVRQAVTHLPLR